MANKPLTFTNYISINGSEPVLMDSLTDEQKEICGKSMAKRLGDAMSEYYTQHPKEYLLLIKALG